MIRRLITAASLIAAIAAPSAAQSNLSVVTSVPVGGVSYTSFTVTGAGTFDLFTTSAIGTGGTTPFDPVLYLFAGLGTSGVLVNSNDDGCAVLQCGPSIADFNSLVNNQFLGTGSYTVAVGESSFSEAEARAGSNPGEFGGAFTLRIVSSEQLGGGDGEADLIGGQAVVPEPGTVLLLASGLLGIIGLRARKQRS